MAVIDGARIVARVLRSGARGRVAFCLLGSDRSLFGRPGASGGYSLGLFQSRPRSIQWSSENRPGPQAMMPSAIAAQVT